MKYILFILDIYCFYVGLITGVALYACMRFRKWQPLLWPVHEAIAAILWVVGWPLCIAGTALKLYHKRNSKKWPERVMLQWSHPWLWLWGNEEDGIDGTRGMLPDPLGGWVYWQQPWIDATRKWPLWRRIAIWSCWRNPVGNLRFVRPFCFDIEPDRVQVIGNVDEFFIWQGAYCGMRRIVFGKKVWIGWKLKPSDTNGLDVDDYRRKGCGFAMQIGDA